MCYPLTLHTHKRLQRDLNPCYSCVTGRCHKPARRWSHTMTSYLSKLAGLGLLTRRLCSCLIGLQPSNITTIILEQILKRFFECPVQVSSLSLPGFNRTLSPSKLTRLGKVSIVFTATKSFIHIFNVLSYIV